MRLQKTLIIFPLIISETRCFLETARFALYSSKFLRYALTEVSDLYGKNIYKNVIFIVIQGLFCNRKKFFKRKTICIKIAKNKASLSETLEYITVAHFIFRVFANIQSKLQYRRAIPPICARLDLDLKDGLCQVFDGLRYGVL